MKKEPDLNSKFVNCTRGTAHCESFFTFPKVVTAILVFILVMKTWSRPSHLGRVHNGESRLSFRIGSWISQPGNISSSSFNPGILSSSCFIPEREVDHHIWVVSTMAKVDLASGLVLWISQPWNNFILVFQPWNIFILMFHPSIWSSTVKIYSIQ